MPESLEEEEGGAKLKAPPLDRLMVVMPINIAINRKMKQLHSHAYSKEEESSLHRFCFRYSLGWRAPSMKSRPSYSRATGEIAQLLRKIDGEVALNLFREAMPRNDEIRCPPRSGWEVARGRLPGIAGGELAAIS